MKTALRNLLLSLLCLSTGLSCFAGSGTESELLKSINPGGFKIAILGPWILSQHEGAAAGLAATEEAGKSCVMVVNVVSASSSGESWNLDLSQGGLKFKKNTSYRLSFFVKGIKVDQISAALAKNHEPWDHVSGGEAFSVNVSPEWQECKITFYIGEDENNGRISFSNFNSQGAVLFLSNISLKEI